MPWCDDCAKFWNPPSMAQGGACPTCGRILTIPGKASATEEDADARDLPRAPWHFKLLLVALVIYLAYRAVQGMVWVAHHV